MSSNLSFGNLEVVRKWINECPKNSFFIVDSKVSSLYIQLFGDHLNMVEVEAGEQLKSMIEYERTVNSLLKLKVDRQSHLIAVGGGTVSDLTGFVASTLFRGVDWSVVPTTLLGMVDAAIGGKTAINLPQGKNLLGAFHFPQNIIIGPEFIDTLELQDIESGLGEVIKYAFLDKNIFNILLEKGLCQETIQACAAYKESIISQDPLDKGIRKTLNLGHSWGHALEKEFSLPHGIAVLLGMKLLFKMEEQSENLEKLNILVQHFKLSPLKLDIGSNLDSILSYLFTDKKRDGEKISFVLPSGKSILKTYAASSSFLSSVGKSIEL